MLGGRPSTECALAPLRPSSHPLSRVHLASSTFKRSSAAPTSCPLPAHADLPDGLRPLYTHQPDPCCQLNSYSARPLIPTPLPVYLLPRSFKDRPPHIVGGGWQHSPGVRAAVKAFAAEHSLPLRVERGGVGVVHTSGVFIRSVSISLTHSLSRHATSAPSCLHGYLVCPHEHVASKQHRDRREG